MKIAKLCDKRSVCYANCQEDHFPNLDCQNTTYGLTYWGNKYTDMFVYHYKNSSFYDECKDLIKENEETPYTYNDEDWVWRT